MKKKNVSTIVLIIVFFIGLSVLLYPVISDFINDLNHSRAIDAYIKAMGTLDPDKYAEEIARAQAYNETLLTRANRFEPTEEELAEYYQLLGGNEIAIGYVEIPAIKVDLPLYLGAEETVLEIGLGCLPGASVPIGGLSTHAAITGHRGLPSAKLLTDLDQVVIGDTFTVFVWNREMTYEIDQIKVVLPHEMEELAIVEDEDYCTLVTCTPYGVNTHRMLVRGHRVAEE